MFSDIKTFPAAHPNEHQDSMVKTVPVQPLKAVGKYFYFNKVYNHKHQFRIHYFRIK